MDSYEKEARKQGFTAVAGVDEAGRGPLAGPLVVAACRLSPKAFFLELNDSKKLTESQRNRLYQALLDDPETDCSIVSIDPHVVDQLNILQATMKGMQDVVSKLATPPDLCLIDGNRAPPLFCKTWPIIKGDSLSKSIAAASILAKVTRDKLMLDLHALFPQYRFDLHKGYPTALHCKYLFQYGPSPIHRASYGPVKKAILENVS